MRRRAEKQGAGQGVVASMRQVLTPLVVGAVDTKRCLLGWVRARGLEALDEVFREEAAVLAGPKGKRPPAAVTATRGPPSEDGTTWIWVSPEASESNATQRPSVGR